MWLGMKKVKKIYRECWNNMIFSFICTLNKTRKTDGPIYDGNSPGLIFMFSNQHNVLKWFWGKNHFNSLLAKTNFEFVTLLTIFFSWLITICTIGLTGYFEITKRNKEMILMLPSIQQLSQFSKAQTVQPHWCQQIKCCYLN